VTGAGGAADAREILRARARALARAPRNGAAAGDCREVVEFVRAQERYALDASCVREVYPLKEITELPCTPPFVPGVVNVRGQILSVLDLGRFLGMDPGEPDEQGKILIVEGDGIQLGILADAVVGMRAIPVREIQPALPTLTPVCAEHLIGITGEQLAVLDVARILSDKRIVVNDEAEA